MDDDDLKEWAGNIWAAVEYNPSTSVDAMKRFIEAYEKAKETNG